MNETNSNSRGHRASICVRACNDIPDEILEVPGYSIKSELDTLDTQIAGRLAAESQRDTAWKELHEIREAINADALESTADEVKSLVSKYNAARRTLEDHGPEGHNCTNQQFTDLRKELDEIEVKVKQACANAYCGNVCACEEEQYKDPGYCCCSVRDAILSAKHII